MNTQERLLRFLKYKNLSKLAFANSIERSPAYVTNIVNTIGAASRQRIAKVYPELNIDWLLTGAGEMLLNKDTTTSVQPTKENMIPLLPIVAQGGNLNDFVVSIREYECEKIISPIDNVDFAITVTGESMSPEYPSGAKVLVSKVNEKAYIDWGRTYVLDTCNGVIIKNVYPTADEEFVKCVSVNPNYPSFEIKTSDIYGWYKVLMCLSLK